MLDIIHALDYDLFMLNTNLDSGWIGKLGERFCNLAIGSRVRFSSPKPYQFSFEHGIGTITDTVEGGFVVVWDDDPLRDSLEYNTNELIVVE